MEAAGVVPRTGIDLNDLSPLFDAKGPFLTVHLVTEAGVENASLRAQQRWKALRRRLADDGAPEVALDAIEDLVADAHLSGATLTAVADASGLRLVEHLDDTIDDDRGTWDALPDLVPLIRWRQSQVPHVLAFADRGGADLVAHGADRHTERSAGDGEPERKVSPGGWSQRRFQQRAENDWARTATDVAAAITRMSDQVDARLIIVGGDVRATHMILDDLPARLTERTHLIEPGRAADGSEGARDQEVHRLLATAVAEDTVALLEKFKEERGQHDRAADGVEATIEALNRAAVDVLLVHDHVGEERTAWLGPQPVPLSLDRDSEISAAPEAPEQGRLIDALVRAAVGTGASIRVIPAAGPVTDGVGALLRWSTPTS